MEDLYGSPVVGNASLGDPATEFALVTPVNVEEATIDGWELAVQHMFGESGFGVIVNVTTVEGDVEYDNANTNKGEGVANQFALLGLSDSANFVGFYDKHGLQVRFAYNWRDDFLDATTDGNAERNPIYIEEYGQWDFNASYEVFDGFQILAEAINFTDETQRKFSRTDEMVISATQQGPRYAIGLRYQF
jgi:TonB-dependent receptor